MKNNILSNSSELNPSIPSWLIWIQCAAFVVLYAVWILPDIVGIRNTALVVGALAGLYPIYCYRYFLLQKRAAPLWLLIILFFWATLHLLFFSQDFAAQFLEYKRIWKYSAIGAIFALGLGLSLAGNAQYEKCNPQNNIPLYWSVIYLGLCAPVLIYIVKYILSMHGPYWGIQPPPYLKIYFSSTDYYVPKNDYVAFCLPPLAITLSQISFFFNTRKRWEKCKYLELITYIFLITSTLFLFYFQNIKNGIVYASVCIAVFVFFELTKINTIFQWKKIIVLTATATCLLVVINQHIKNNNSWKSFIADAKIAMKINNYEYWKFAGERGYPLNELGSRVSDTNYDRIAWLLVGLQLVPEKPLGYGLIEGSFKRIANEKWSESSSNLSHTHSGWLDLILAIGIPGFLLILTALIILMIQTVKLYRLWGGMIFWVLFSLSILWLTTEVSATVTFSALIFWITFCAGLSSVLPCKSNKNLHG